MLIQTCIVTATLCGLAALASLQKNPDFSGEWILNRQASTLSPGADAMRSAVVRIEHRDPAFKYNAEFVSDTGTVKYDFELQSDGSDVRSTQPGITIVSNLRWEGEALVANWLIQRPDGEMKISFRYEMLDAGRRLRAVEQLRGTDHDQDNIWMFERR